jgi:hypothetical protein
MLLQLTLFTSILRMVLCQIFQIGKSIQMPATDQLKVVYSPRLRAEI